MSKKASGYHCHRFAFSSLPSLSIVKNNRCELKYIPVLSVGSAAGWLMGGDAEEEKKN